MRKIFLSITILAGLALFFSCGSKGDPEASETGESKPGETHVENIDPDLAVLTEAQIKSIGIELGMIEEKQLTASLKTNGILQVPNQNKASVNSVYSGVIKSLLVQPGNLVRKGQTIATIANPEFIQAQSQYLGVTSKIALAELEVKRQKELNEGNAGALKNLQAAETDLKTLRTTRSTLAQQIQLMGIDPAKLSNGQLISVLSVSSPISGVVSNVSVKMGSYIDVTTPVAEIVDNSQLHLDLFVYEKDLHKLKNNQTIHFSITNNPGREYDAQIYSLGSSFEGQSKAVTVHAKVQGDKTGLIDGMSVTAVISLDQSTVPAVPNEAIVMSEGKDFIFVLIPGGRDTTSAKGKEKEFIFERIPVAKGTSDVGYTEITLLKEIPQGTRIVVKGAFFVLAKMTNTEGHAD